MYCITTFLQAANQSKKARDGLYDERLLGLRAAFASHKERQTFGEIKGLCGSL